MHRESVDIKIDNVFRSLLHEESETLKAEQGISSVYALNKMLCVKELDHVRGITRQRLKIFFKRLDEDIEIPFWALAQPPSVIEEARRFFVRQGITDRYSYENVFLSSRQRTERMPLPPALIPFILARIIFG